jgi:hypothetical protein
MVNSSVNHCTSVLARAAMARAVRGYFQAARSAMVLMPNAAEGGWGGQQQQQQQQQQQW